MKRNNVLRNTQGFTLVELAIVLVIIGLIVGGVLKGRELITSAKVKSTANQLSSVSSATETFRDKYKTAAFFNMTSVQKAGLLTGTGGMNNKFGGDVFLYKSVVFGGKTYTAVASTLVPGDIAKMVDALIDDGNPATGTVIVIAKPATALAIDTAATTLQTLLGTPLDSATVDASVDTSVIYLF